MSILEHLEKETLNELINYSFTEVREVFNLNRFFVSDAQGDQFINEAAQIKTTPPVCFHVKKVRKTCLGEGEILTICININQNFQGPFL